MVSCGPVVVSAHAAQWVALYASWPVPRAAYCHKAYADPALLDTKKRTSWAAAVTLPAKLRAPQPEANKHGVGQKGARGEVNSRCAAVPRRILTCTSPCCLQPYDRSEAKGSEHSRHARRGGGGHPRPGIGRGTVFLALEAYGIPSPRAGSAIPTRAGGGW